MSEVRARQAQAGDDPKLRPVVARYDAVLSLDIERSAFTIVDRGRAEAARRRFEEAPGYAPIWPPAPARGRYVSSSAMSLEGVLLSRLLVLLDFGAVLKGDTHDDLRSAVAARWAELDEQRQRRINGLATTAFERVVVEALIREDGYVEWGFTHGESGRTPLPLSGRANGSRSEYDLYIQNLARADLAAMLAAA